MNSPFMARTLLIRLLLLLAAIGVSVTLAPPASELSSTRSTPTQTASRQSLSVHLDAW